ncbi:oxygenase MpaB family protein [Streptomyces nymphaeiformis]|uniref:ER-bound oxygenase mpaB/mpaB'/Rubber oxygenase catalytic domain-containing protein n=1 Tax=Streptomyces nymphaeiformis TaxID=2663842 RepID=A0A7W7XEN4_9ACTN|nr:oxygenase MpaB family protein [Streptomyces nymphaeiformis]MBB4984333.1 hypothetical protein [Streptomyces nymphaeiformis]
MHDHFSRTYAFSNETYVHGIALFTLLFDEIFGHVGIDAFSEAEKDAQVQHWRTIAEQMHVKDVPTTWAGMQQALRTYETSPDWYRRTPAGQRCAESLVGQFNHRWLPRPLHPLGRALLLSLQHDHVLAAIGQPKPPAIVARTVRVGMRLALRLQQRTATRANQSTHRH